MAKGLRQTRQKPSESAPAALVGLSPLAEQSAPKKRLRGKANLLTRDDVRDANEPGRYADGDRLYLRVRDVGGRLTKFWELRYTSPTGRRVDLGLGSAESVSLANARKLASEARVSLHRGVDPADAKATLAEALRTKEAAKKANAQRERLTLARFARQYHEGITADFRNAKHAQQWINSLEQHVPAEIWHKPIADVEAGELEDALRALQQKLPETGRRVRQRLETIFATAAVRGHCAGNPAAAVRKLLRAKRPRSHFAALPWHDVPAFVRRLQAAPGASARALEFALLTASRTSEVLLATFSEFDLKRATWTVPAERMKAGEAHTVYLSPRAVEIVAEQKKGAGKRAIVFESPSGKGRPLSNMAFLMTLRRLKEDGRTTAHGLCRASFSTWANESGYRPDVIEASLAHKESDAVRRAYNRAEFVEARKALMDAWATFCASAPEAA